MSSPGSSPPRVKKIKAHGLLGNKRGSSVAVAVRGSYGNYTFDDVCRLGVAIESGKIKVGWLKPSHEKHNSQEMNVPFTTMRYWLDPDEKVMAKKELRGCQV